MSDTVHCSEEGCTAEFKNHRWGHIKAHSEGWFEQKDGQRWCPEHKPAWVDEWRGRQGVARPKQETVHLSATCIGCTQQISKPLGEGQAWTHDFSEEASCW